MWPLIFLIYFAIEIDLRKKMFDGSCCTKSAFPCATLMKSYGFCGRWGYVHTEVSPPDFAGFCWLLALPLYSSSTEFLKIRLMWVLQRLFPEVFQWCSSFHKLENDLLKNNEAVLLIRRHGAALFVLRVVEKKIGKYKAHIFLSEGLQLFVVKTVGLV